MGLLPEKIVLFGAPTVSILPVSVLILNLGSRKSGRFQGGLLITMVNAGDECLPCCLVLEIILGLSIVGLLPEHIMLFGATAVSILPVSAPTQPLGSGKGGRFLCRLPITLILARK